MKKVIISVIAIVSFIGIGFGCWKMQQGKDVDTSYLDENSLKKVATIQSEQYIVLNGDKEKYLKGKSYDSAVVKEVKVKHLDEVDTSKEGTYELTYEYTVDARALDAYIKGKEVKASAHPIQTVVIPIKSTVTVIPKEKALEIRKTGRAVYGL